MTKLKLVQTSPTREDIFVQRYTLLSKWALQLTRGDQQKAEDLVQDAFVQFAIANRELEAIQNVDAYLYGMLRNLHLSEVRRAARSPIQPRSIIEYDSAELGLCAIDARDQIRVQDELRRICHYACWRKESSKAGSVLILRFFHGYYPSEIVTVAKISREAVEKRLELGRMETKLYLTNPGFLNFVGKGLPRETSYVHVALTPYDLLLELRTTIFDSRQRSCPSESALKQLYTEGNAEAISCAFLSHLVSCPDCLDRVNSRLKLQPLFTRFPTDTLGPEVPGANPRDDVQTSSPNSRYVGPDVKTHRRLRQVYEHRPHQLSVAVNGYVKASQSIRSELSELNLNIDQAEPAKFIEVFSEQGLRLLLLSVEEPPPSGSYQRMRCVELSDGRTLEAVFCFSSPCPSVTVTYKDPLLRLLQDTAPDLSEAGEETGDDPLPEQSRSTPDLLTFWSRIFNAHPGLGEYIRRSLVPCLGTILLLVIIGGALILTRRPHPQVSASQFLRDSAVAEVAAAPQNTEVIHRTISLEARTESGVLISTNKIDVWRSNGMSARRLYDSRNRIEAGEWVNADKSRILNRNSHGQRRSEDRSNGLNFDNVWRREPSSKSFSALLNRPEIAKVQVTEAVLIIRYDPENGFNVPGLIGATLTINRRDLRATEETLSIRDNGEVREFRLTETSLERRPKSSVPASVFEPDRDLAYEPKAQPVIDAELEVHALGLLSDAGGDTGEQVDIARTKSGKLVISGVVETEERKKELLRAFAPLSGNPAVLIDLSTVSEIISRRKLIPAPMDHQPTVALTYAPPDSSIPVARELRDYFVRSGIPEARVDDEIQSYSSAALAKSLRLRQHASALNRLGQRFTPQQLTALSHASRVEWVRMAVKHATLLRNEAARLREQLSPAFPEPTSNTETETLQISNAAELSRATGRLVLISSGVDRMVSSAFTMSSGTSLADELRSPEFWRSLSELESEASRVTVTAQMLERSLTTSKR